MGTIRRADIVLIVAQGDHGKPRPAVVVQSDLFQATRTAAVCPMTSLLIDAPLLRLLVEPTAANGLQKPSHIMVDKIITLNKNRIRDVIGVLDQVTMTRLNRSLAVFLGLPVPPG